MLLPVLSLSPFPLSRDFVDCRNALKYDCFKPHDIREGFTKEMEEICRQKLKLHKVRPTVAAVMAVSQTFAKASAAFPGFWYSFQIFHLLLED